MLYREFLFIPAAHPPHFRYLYPMPVYSSARKTRQFVASSILEVVVALALLSLVFVIGSQVWMRAVVLRHPAASYDIRVHMRALSMEAGFEALTGSSRHEYAGYHCIRTVRLERKGGNLYRVAIQCYRGEQLLGQRTRIVKHPENERIHDH